jgi:hypothetical protein
VDKARENAAALSVLQDLLADIDASGAAGSSTRWMTLIEGALAANIFDW